MPNKVMPLAKGGAAASSPGPAPAELKKLYRAMVLVRLMDERCLNLQRQGRIGFYVGCRGQEAAIIGSGYAMRPEDWIAPSYREHGVALLRGVPLRLLIHQLYGTSADLTRGRQMPNHFAFRDIRYVSVSSPIGTQIPQAVGIAMAAKYRGDPAAVIAYFGDGATSSNDFHAGMNFAGVYKAPVVFFCQNNRWAITLPVSLQTASESIAIKTRAYGFDGVQVDGNDVLAVYKATREAADKARAGGGPTLIEALTYRMGAHSTSDDPRRYREERETKEWEARDPIRRFRAHLESQKLWSPADEEELIRRIKDEINESVREAGAAPPPPRESLFQDVYAEIPPHLQEQMEDLTSSEGGRHG